MASSLPSLHTTAAAGKVASPWMPTPYAVRDVLAGSIATVAAKIALGSPDLVAHTGVVSTAAFVAYPCSSIGKVPAGSLAAMAPNATFVNTGRVMMVGSFPSAARPTSTGNAL